MSLRNEFEASGEWLFRRRSFLPLVTAPLLAAALASFGYLGGEHWREELWNVICLCISLLGLVVRVCTIGYAPSGTSGRNTRKQVANVLNTAGMYSLVRHPLYLGNYLITLGIALYFHTWWMLLIVTCVYALYYKRIMFAEEAYLRARFGDQFQTWAARTPAILPRVHGWQEPELPFSWRTVLRREYTGLFGIVAVFVLLEVAGDSLAEQRLRIDWPWIWLLACTGAIYLSLRTLKRHSMLLQESAR
jgi:protein-S-isoprenylcysteine O-methyltransferase Ste14